MPVALLLSALALAAAVAGRWTRLHPMVVGTILALVPGGLGAMAMAGFMAGGRAILLFGGVAFLLGAAVGSFGAWMGRLRRQHVERTG